MIRDILTVMWKERKGLFRQKGSRMRTAFVLLVPAIALGILLPIQEGRGWVEGYWSLIGSVLVPLLLVATLIPESFAGERERHTLGTLLASRLTDRAILFGKVTMAVSFGWGVTLLVLVLSLVTVNITHWDGQVLLFTPTIALTNVAMSLLMACFMAGLGVLISLRAATVQGASMVLVAATFLPLVILQIAGMVFLQMGAGGRDRLNDIITTVDWTQVRLIAMAVLVVACVALFWAATARFKRTRLMLG